MPALAPSPQPPPLTPTCTNALRNYHLKARLDAAVTDAELAASLGVGGASQTGARPARSKLQHDISGSFSNGIIVAGVPANAKAKATAGVARAGSKATATATPASTGQTPKSVTLSGATRDSDGDDISKFNGLYVLDPKRKGHGYPLFVHAYKGKGAKTKGKAESHFIYRHGASGRWVVTDLESEIVGNDGYVPVLC